jgi:hypothetical protein
LGVSAIAAVMMIRGIFVSFIFLQSTKQMFSTAFIFPQKETCHLFPPNQYSSSSKPTTVFLVLFFFCKRIAQVCQPFNEHISLLVFFSFFPQFWYDRSAQLCHAEAIHIII